MPTTNGIKVILPDELQLPENRPCKYAWGFQIENSRPTKQVSEKQK
jgi:hypothetical protein